MSIFVYNFIPEDGSQYVNPALTISFSIVSDGDPIDLSSVNVYFSETNFSAPAIFGGAAQDGYNSIISATIEDGLSGYAITITPSSFHRNNTIAIQIEADSTPSSGTTVVIKRFSTTTHIGIIGFADSITYGTTITSGGSVEHQGLTFSGRRNNIIFQLNDKTEPVVTNRIPVANSVDNPRNTSIKLSLHDNGQEGVDITSLDVYLDGIQVISSGAFSPGYLGSVTETYIDGFAGFSIIINNPGLFVYNSTHYVRVVVRDLISDPLAVNTLDTTYQFGIINYIDYDGPSSEPTMPPTGFPLDGCIEFDWLDAPFGTGPDFSTLGVTLRRELTSECITTIRDDVAVINGVATPGYTMYAYDIEVGYQNGYHITLCPAIPFNELEIVTVIISGQDSQGNDGSSSFDFSTQEATPPEILNFDPEPNSIISDHESPVKFDMHDSAGSGIDIERLTVKMDDGEAVINGSAQPGYNFSYERDMIIDRFGFSYDGYHFSIVRDQPFVPGKAIAIEIDGYDAYGNRATEDYYFTTDPDTTPPYFVFDPPSGITNVQRDTLIAVEIRDSLGVDRNSINISVQGNAAVRNGIGLAPYDVFVYETELAPGIIDGYKFVIDAEYDFKFNESVVVYVEGTDIFGNSSSGSATFVTYNDITPPSISAITPRDSQTEVSLRPSIEFVLRDGYDIDLYRTNVSLNGNAIVIDGAAQRGFSLNISRIDGGNPPGVEPGDGYYFAITPQNDLHYNDSIDIAIMGFDKSIGNRVYETVSWYTISPNPPRFDMVPTNGQIGVDIDANILFEVFDDGYDVDINSLNLSMDGTPIIINNVIQTPDYDGSITILDGYHHYVGIINPRFLLAPNSTHTIAINAREIVSGNFNELSYTFNTSDSPENPKTVYIGDENGVESVVVDSVTGEASTTAVMDGYYVYDIHAKVLKYINRIAVATRDSGAILCATNYSMNPIHYSAGDEVTSVRLTTNHGGTLYLANKSKERIDVYYNILYDDSGRNIPDVYYCVDGYSPEGLDDGYFTDLVVTEGTSTIASGSNSIFVGTPNGAFRIETDETDSGSSEANGQIISYGASGSDTDYPIFEGTTNYVVAIDVNVRLNHLYVATRNDDPNDKNAVTYINLEDNTFAGSITESRLIHRLINDISFEDQE